MDGSVKQLLMLKGEPLWHDWRWQWRNRINSAEKLFLALPELDYDYILEKSGDLSRYRLPFATTPYYLSLANPENRSCPILTQLLPDLREFSDNTFIDEDPYKEKSQTPVPGLIHRYRDKVLWCVSARCAVHCRFCMRRGWVSENKSPTSPGQIEKVLTYIRNNSAIKEVILSGGDPLALSDAKIAEILNGLGSIKRKPAIRIHTRIPVTLPMRITPALTETLRKHLPLKLVTHFNHPLEISKEAVKSIEMLRSHGVSLFNQAVLLAGVNDTAPVQKELYQSLLLAGVKPYYLHQCDAVRGVFHFQTPVNKGLQIMKTLGCSEVKGSLPRYVRDVPGRDGKEEIRTL